MKLFNNLYRLFLVWLIGEPRNPCKEDFPTLFTEKEKELRCTCKENNCRQSICRGECGCEKCFQDYNDFLSTE